MNPLAYCQQKLQENQQGLPYAFRHLNTTQRHAITVIYAFYDELENILYRCQDEQVARSTLQWWRKDSQKVYTQQTPEHPIHLALRDILPSFALPYSELDELIEGRIMDLTQARYTDFTWLNEYCRRSSGLLFKIVARILGVNHEHHLHTAECLGIVHQLCRIISEVGADARQGRIYLPMNEMQTFQVPAAIILQGQANTAFEQLMHHQIQRVKQLAQKALHSLDPQHNKILRPLLCLTAIDFALLTEIERDGVAQVLTYRIAIPKPRQQRIVWKTRLLGLRLPNPPKSDRI